MTLPISESRHLIMAAFLWGIFISPNLIAQEAEDSNHETSPIRFIAYNVRNYLAMPRQVDGKSKDHVPKPAEEIEALVEILKAGNPDILGICEIDDNPHLGDLQNRLKKVGIDLPHRHIVKPPESRPRSLALLSRFPITSSNSQDRLQYKIDGKDFPHSRGILDATVAVNPDYQLRLIGLHLKSKREIPEGDQARMRLAEATLARQHVEKILNTESDTNLLIYGDLNDTRNQPAVRILKGRYGNKLYCTEMKLTDSNGLRWTHHWDWEEIYAKLDFILLSHSLKPEVDSQKSRILDHPNWSLASDHRPLLVTIIPEEKNK